MNSRDPMTSTRPSDPATFPNATPRPWTLDTIEGGGWAVVVDAGPEGAKVVAELDDTYGDRAANAALIVAAVNAYNFDPENAGYGDHPITDVLIEMRQFVRTTRHPDLMKNQSHPGWISMIEEWEERLRAALHSKKGRGS